MNSGTHDTLGYSSNTQNTPMKGQTSTHSTINNFASIRNNTSTTEFNKVANLLNKGAKNKNNIKSINNYFPKSLTKGKSVAQDEH